MDPAPSPPAPGRDAPLLVFLVPLGPGRHELYCERQHTRADEAPVRGWFAGLRQRFSAMLKAAEEGEDDGAESAGFMARVQARMMAWVAERVAEQRLLWNLRSHDAALVTHPDDLPFDAVMQIVQQSLRADHRRHTRWLMVDTLLLIASGVFFFVPGPEHHRLLLRLPRGRPLAVDARGGARPRPDGLERPAVAGADGAPAAAVARPPHERDRAVEAIARELGLQRLARSSTGCWCRGEAECLTRVRL